MIKTVTVTNFRNESLMFDLTHPEESGFAIASIEGLGPVTATINMSEGAAYDGAFYTSSRAGTRNIVMNLIMYDDGSKSIESLRQKLYRYFPIKRKLTFEIETDNRRVKTEGYVETVSPNIFSDKESAQISILCPDSYFYSTPDNKKSIRFYSASPAFEFPFSNESLTDPLLKFSEYSKSQTETINYEGDAEAGVTLFFDFFNTSSRLVIGTTRGDIVLDLMLGNEFVAGDRVVISTVKGNKYARRIRNGNVQSILNLFDRHNLNFDDITLLPGENEFTTQGLENAIVTMEYDLVYEGV